jgi:hypothetical protein
VRLALYSRRLARPIFIVGAMGSGTTLVRLVLDSHPNIAIPRETGFMRGYDALRFTPFKWHGNWTRRLGWKPGEIDELMAGVYEQLFRRYADRHGKERWGEKSPLHTWHLEDMARLFPDAQFIGVVRHPGASAQSNIDRFKRMGIGKADRHWRRYTHEIVRNAALRGDRFALIRYEDLVLHPEQLLRQLIEWLGEPWSDNVLQHHEVVPAREGKARAVEGWTRTDEAIDTSRVAKWTQRMRDDHKKWLAPRVEQRAEFFGYSMDHPEPVAPFAASGKLIVLGSELDERIERYPELELRDPREPPLTDAFYDPQHVMMLTRADYEQLIERRGARGVGVRLARRLPPGPRARVIRAVRGARAALGLRRQPPTH